MPTLFAGRYEFLRNIGSGSFGLVRLYRDTLGPPQSVVAIKSIPYAKIIQEGHRLIREIEIMLFLRDAHPHIINCYHAFAALDSRATAHVTPEEIPNLPAELIPIRSIECLQKWVEEVGIVQSRIEAIVKNKQHLRVDHTSSGTPNFSIHLVLPFMNGDVDKFIEQFRKDMLAGPSGRGMAYGEFWATTVAVIAFQMLFGMDFLHKSKIVHRDLKPENILLRIDLASPYCSSALVADFGLACLEANDGTFYVCTRTYRPPELLVGRQTAHSSIDVWSLGCILYELVTWDRLVDIPSSRDKNTQEWNGTQAAAQLEIVMDTAGTPSHEDIMTYLVDDADPVKSYLLKTKPRPSRIRDLMVNRFRLPGCSVEIRDLWIDLVISCLRFFPEQRPTTEDLCKHPLFVTYGMVYGQNVNQYPATDYQDIAHISNRPEANVLTALGLLHDHLTREVAEGTASPSLAPLASPTLGPAGPEDVINCPRAVTLPYLRTEDLLDKYSNIPLNSEEDIQDATDACELDTKAAEAELADNPNDTQLQIRLEDLINLRNFLSKVDIWRGREEFEE